MTNDSTSAPIRSSSDRPRPLELIEFELLNSIIVPWQDDVAQETPTKIAPEGRHTNLEMIGSFRNREWVL